MNTFTAAFAAAVLCAASLPFLITGEAPATKPATVPVAPTSFVVDGMHSGVTFIIKHADVSNFYGRFNKIAGKFTIDDAKLEASSIEVTIDADSIDTNSKERDNHVKGPDLLDVKQFPSITLKSKSIAKTEKPGTYKVVADMSMHGVTKEVSINVFKVGEGELNPRFGYRCGYEAMFSFKRSDFGMKAMIEQKMLGDDIRAFVSIEGAVEK